MDNLNKIKTYNTEEIREKFMKQAEKLNQILKPEFSKFFIVRVQDMILLIKLPVPPTRTTSNTFIYLTAGEAVMNIGSETFKIAKDQCLFVPAGQLFSFKNRDINKGFLCNFPTEFIAWRFTKTELHKSFEFLKVWGNPVIKLDKNTSKNVHQLLKRIHSDYAANGLTNNLILQSYFSAILCEINAAYRSINGNKSTKSVLLSNKFKDLLFNHITKMHLVSAYAAMLHVTPNHLNKVIKQVTGKSPTKWIDETLIMEAKVILYQTNYSISKVAEELGILDPSYFSRLFKKQEGLTPTDFRKMIEKS